jgi:hypothetical protein
MKFSFGYVYCSADRRLDIAYCPETIQYFRYYTISSKLPSMDTIYYASNPTTLKLDCQQYCALYIDFRRSQWPRGFCGRSLAVIAGSNPVGGMDVCLL